MEKSITKVRYEHILQASNDLKRIKESNVEIANKYKEIIDSFKNDKSLSSKIITPSMDNMISEIDEVNKNFKILAENFSEFLDTEILSGYKSMDTGIGHNMIDIQENDNKKELINLDYTDNVYTSCVENKTSTYLVDGKYNYNDDDFKKLCAIVAGEDNKSYDGSLAVVSVMCNRANDSRYPSDPLACATQSGQFTAYQGLNYNQYMNGEKEIPSYVVQAVSDALSGTRNNEFLSFRAQQGKEGGRIQIGEGGNYYFT